MSGIQGKPFGVILLAATISTLLACSSPRKNMVFWQAEMGDAKAQSQLGTMYAKGQGVPQDYTEAARWFRKAAEQGDAQAQLNLGILYDNGNGVIKLQEEAFNWYKKAAEQGNAHAQYNLGVAYAGGLGVPQDMSESLKWTRKAAEQWVVEAQYNLGVMYFRGLGVPQDFVQSYLWSSLAASQLSGDRYKESTEVRDQAEKNLTPEQLVEAQRLTSDWEKSHPR